VILYLLKYIKLDSISVNEYFGHRCAR